MIQLEKYKGNRTRHTCPGCGSKNAFTRYVGDDGQYLADDVGRCNRESKCNYHRTPKEYFADNPPQETGKPKRRPKNYGFAAKPTVTVVTLPKKIDYISFEQFMPTLGNYSRNAFVQFLLNLFPEDAEAVQDVLRMYFVGTFDDYTCFPSIDRLNRICRAKLVRFNPKTGRRLKGDYDTSSLPAKLNLKDFNYKQIFFGEHLLTQFPNKPVAIVESEKTAILASICLPQFVWLGCNSKQWLNVDRLRTFGNRKITLYPDADGFDAWRKIAQDARRQGIDADVSTIIEKHATSEQKAEGYDLADYLVSEQRAINRYNAKLDAVMSDPESMKGLYRIFEERIYVAEECGNLSRAEAEAITLDRFEIRRVIEAI